jgi:hypothetical protein
MSNIELVVAMAVHIKNQDDLEKLKRCFKSIAAQTGFRNDVKSSIPIRMAISRYSGEHEQALDEFLTELDDDWTKLLIYESVTILQQFQHYERLAQEMVSQIPDECECFVMFSDGDDIWESIRYHTAFLHLRGTHAPPERSYVCAHYVFL